MRHILCLVRGLLGLLVDVVQQGLPVQGASGGLSTVVRAPTPNHAKLSSPVMLSVWADPDPAFLHNALPD